MRFITVVLSVFLFQVSFAQVKPGFEPSEARDMIAICNSFSFLKQYHNDDAIRPKGYERIYTSDIIVGPYKGYMKETNIERYPHMFFPHY